MTEKRSKTMSVLLKNESKAAVKIELFPSGEWSATHGVGRDLFRLRINGRWSCNNGEKYSFLTLDGAMNEVCSLITDYLDHPHPCQQKPMIKSGTPVRVPVGEVAGQTIYERTFAATPPIKCIDGRWYVGVIMFGKGTKMIPVDSMEIQA